MPRRSRRLVLATRGSELALRQAGTVASTLESIHGDVEVEIRVVRTRGDRDQRPFAEIGGKGLFTSEVERTLVEGEADIAVHSAKDLTAELAPGCIIGAMPERHAPEDVVVGGDAPAGEQRLADLPSGAVVGTSSMRRRALLSEMRGDLEIVELRGNLDTRLRKVAAGEVDAAILARAGLERIGSDADFGPLSPDRWVPPPGQGALAVEANAEREDVLELLGALDHHGTRAEVTCERAFAARLEGGCSVPLGCWASERDGMLIVTGFLGLPDGMNSIRDRISGPLADASSLGVELADAIIASGGSEILEELKHEEPPGISAP